MRRIAIEVTGIVQGVFFRASTKHIADHLGIKGFVKNQPDGSVYIEAEGDDGTLEEFLSWCRRGPDHARVDELKVDALPVSGSREFVIKR